ncbi:MAG: DUF3343 domain-containing protein [Desulfuromonas thiophila]|jgi:hypothetical protein|nr:DUF3343 domain-containing protein [Desulfuromonas thiophila]MDY0397427.1 DUF3343 domain-containing protein [Desulfuromonas thiophila]
MRMVGPDQCLLVFDSLHRVMRAEQLLQERFSVLLVPLPRVLSSDCGMALRILAADWPAIAASLQQAELIDYRCYQPTATGFAVVDLLAQES